MTRILATLTLIATLTFSAVSPAMSFDWSSVVAKLDRSTVALQIALLDGRLATDCTAISINEQAHAYLTAGHCVGVNPVYVDGQMAYLAIFDAATDLAVVVAPLAKVRPAVRPRIREIRAGIEVGAYGYGLGHPEPFFRAGNVSAVNHVLPELTRQYPIYKTQRFLVLDQTYIGGMSGGPVVDIDGRLVSIVQMGMDSLHIGVGRAIDVIMATTGVYWQHQS